MPTDNTEMLQTVAIGLGDLTFITDITELD